MANGRPEAGGVENRSDMHSLMTYSAAFSQSLGLGYTWAGVKQSQD